MDQQETESDYVDIDVESNTGSYTQLLKQSLYALVIEFFIITGEY
jgi:hypothetical protein